MTETQRKSRSLGAGAATRLLETVSKRLWNLRANLMSDIVDQHGAAQSIKWFASNMPAYEKILKSWGPLRTHYLAVAVSAANGCAYCTYGHAYAFVLHHFDQTGVVFPLSEDELRDLGQREGDQIRAALTDALEDADMHDEVEWLHRILDLQIELTAGASLSSTSDSDDRRLAQLVHMFGWLNACGINADTEPDEAHDPINKNQDLRRRYAEARAAASQS